ncbi:8539_t:CDS:2, partial [Gigaspora margarita]
PTSIQNVPLPENLTPIGDLISFDENIPIYYPNVSNVPVVDLLPGDIPDIKAESSSNANIEQKKNQFLMIDGLIKWLTKLEIKSNKKIRLRSIPKTEKEWFDLIESNNNESNDPEPQQNGIQYTKDMFKVDGAEYAFSTWFIDTEEHKLKAGMTEDEYLIRVKFIRADTVISDKKTKRGFKIIDKYEPICESKKAGRKYVRSGPNVILTKKMKLGFWVGIDEKFLVREVSGQSEVEKLDSNAHFDQAKRGHGLTKIRWQKINNWEKKMRIPGARVQDVA